MYPKKFHTKEAIVAVAAAMFASCPGVIGVVSLNINTIRDARPTLIKKPLRLIVMNFAISAVSDLFFAPNVQYLFQKYAPKAEIMKEMPLKMEKLGPVAMPVNVMRRLSVPQSRNVLNAPTAPNFANWKKIGIRFPMSHAIANAKFANIVKNVMSPRTNIGVIVMKGICRLERIGIANSANDIPIKDTK